MQLFGSIMLLQELLINSVATFSSMHVLHPSASWKPPVVVSSIDAPPVVPKLKKNTCTKIRGNTPSVPVLHESWRYPVRTRIRRTCPPAENPLSWRIKAWTMSQPLFQQSLAVLANRIHSGNQRNSDEKVCRWAAWDSGMRLWKTMLASSSRIDAWVPIPQYRKYDQF